MVAALRASLSSDNSYLYLFWALKFGEVFLTNKIKLLHTKYKENVRMYTKGHDVGN